EDPPVPTPNTEVKLSCAENTWREAAWEDKSAQTSNPVHSNRVFSFIRIYMASVCGNCHGFKEFFNCFCYTGKKLHRRDFMKPCLAQIGRASCRDRVDRAEGGGA